MEKRTKRARGSNWNHAHTMALAELRKEASLNNEDGRLVWERIAQTLSSRFPGQIRTGAQCRRRWDTLVKVYNHIEDYCIQTGAQDHRELDEGELASMKLETAYQQDWYGIVEQVCSQRKRKERCGRDLMLAKRSKGSTGSHSVELPERPPNKDTLCSASTSKSVTHHELSTPESTKSTLAQVSSSQSLEADKLGPEEEVPKLENGKEASMLEQSTSAYAEVSSSPSLEVDKLSPEKKVPRLKNGNDGLVLQATQVRQHEQVSHEVSQESQTLESVNVLPHTFLAENGVQLKEPLQNDLWAWDDDLPFAEIEQPDAESEFAESYWDLESIGFGAQPKEPLYSYDMWDDSLQSNIMSIAGESDSSGISFSSPRPWHSGRRRLLSEVDDLPEWVSPSDEKIQMCLGSTAFEPPIKHLGAVSTADMPVFVYLEASFYVILGASFFVILGALLFGIQDTLLFVFLGALLFVFLGAMIMTPRISSRSADSKISRQSRRWSLKGILSKIRQYCHACCRKERTEDMEMETYMEMDMYTEMEMDMEKFAQLVSLVEAREKAEAELLIRKENISAMLNAATSTSDTRGDKHLQKDTERTSKQSCVGRGGRRHQVRRAERQRLERS